MVLDNISIVTNTAFSLDLPSLLHRKLKSYEHNQFLHQYHHDSRTVSLAGVTITVTLVTPALNPDLET